MCIRDRYLTYIDNIGWQLLSEMINFVSYIMPMPDSAMRHTFRKPEKLCSQNIIDRLFAEGKSISARQFRLIYFENEGSAKPPVKVMIAVSKKNFKHAVNRNRMKRLIREAYRVSKHKILEEYTRIGKHCEIAFIFNGKKYATHEETLAAINELLDRLIHTHEKNPQ
jgi:ribonuclease P protein component